MSKIKLGFTAKQIIEEGRVTQEEIESIRDWLLTQDLPELIDEQIIVFIVACSNQLKAVKKTIKAYYALTKNSPEIFDNRRMDREDIQKVLTVGEGAIIPQLRDDGCTVTMIRLKDTYYRNFCLESTLIVLTMALDYLIYHNPPKGLVLVCDLRGVGLLHLTRLKFGILKILFDYLQNALPAKMVEIHMVNVVYFMDKLMAILKPFMSKKVLNMMHFHPPDMDWDSFHEQWIPKRCLPGDYGGDLPDLKVLSDEITESLYQFQPYFEEEELQRRGIK